MTAARPLIVALSDATGETAEQAGKAALAQFGHREEGAVRVVSNIRTAAALEEAIRRARQLGAMVVYTLVEPELHRSIQRVAREHGVVAVDLIGGLIRGLADHLDQSPLEVPGLSHELGEEYFRRVAAVEFTVHHDDGKNVHNLGKAEIVLVGISRTSKTPLSNYIAHRGYKVANVPIVMGVPLPPQLEDVDPRRVFGLTIDPVVLMNVRQARMERMGLAAGSDYGDLRQIRREIDHARRIFAAHPGWMVIDMSRKAVEEAATTVIESWRSRFGEEAAEQAGACPEGARTEGPEGARAEGPEGARTEGPEGARAEGPEGARAEGPDGAPAKGTR